MQPPDHPGLHGEDLRVHVVVDVVLHDVCLRDFCLLGLVKRRYKGGKVEHRAGVGPCLTVNDVLRCTRREAVFRKTIRDFKIKLIENA